MLFPVVLQSDFGGGEAVGFLAGELNFKAVKFLQGAVGMEMEPMTALFRDNRLNRSNDSAAVSVGGRIDRVGVGIFKVKVGGGASEDGLNV